MGELLLALTSVTNESSQVWRLRVQILESSQIWRFKLHRGNRMTKVDFFLDKLLSTTVQSFSEKWDADSGQVRGLIPLHVVYEITNELF